MYVFWSVCKTARHLKQWVFTPCTWTVIILLERATVRKILRVSVASIGKGWSVREWGTGAGECFWPLPCCASYIWTQHFLAQLEFCILFHILPAGFFIIVHNIIKPARARGPEGPARWERKSCYWQTVPPQVEGGRLIDRSVGFFYKNSCNSGTESQKIVPKVGN